MYVHISFMLNHIQCTSQMVDKEHTYTYNFVDCWTCQKDIIKSPTKDHKSRRNPRTWNIINTPLKLTKVFKRTFLIKHQHFNVEFLLMCKYDRNLYSFQVLKERIRRKRLQNGSTHRLNWEKRVSITIFMMIGWYILNGFTSTLLKHLFKIPLTNLNK